MTYFSDSYTEANDKFKSIVHERGLRLEELMINDTTGQILEICITELGDSQAENLVIHSSGLHGVEAYVGSAIQLKFLNEYEEIPPNTKLVLIHVLNPFGMHFNRRFNENNVDLNRNFIDLQPDDLPESKAYEHLNLLLNPQKKSALGGFKIKAFLKILRYGFSTLQQSVAQGQYRFEKGLFFGGHQLEKGSHQVLKYLAAHNQKYRKVYVLDVHAGLGKYGKEALYLEGFQSKTDREILEKSLKTNIIHVEKNAKDAYEIYGGYIQRLSKLYDKTNFYGITQEFGVAKPLDVLKDLRRENFYHHHHPGADEDLHAKSKLKMRFCPPNYEWRKHALDKGVLRLNQLLGKQA